MSRVLDLLRVQHPIIQAPMAGAQGAALAIEVAKAGGLGSIPCALLSIEGIYTEVRTFRQATDQPFNLNFFCHQEPEADPAKEQAWRDKLAPYYQELNIQPDPPQAGPARRPFNDEALDALLDLKPPIVSFHFGLPSSASIEKIKRENITILASATTAKEAQWLESNGADAVIAQGLEAGGHRGMFLSADLATQVGLFALLPAIKRAISLPVIAAGGIANRDTIKAAHNLGADAVQIGTAYLHCPESIISAVHRANLKTAQPEDTIVTNIYTGRPARGILNRLIRELGPISAEAPAFPNAAPAVLALRKHAEANGLADFAQMWAGQSAALGRSVGAADLTAELV